MHKHRFAAFTLLACFTLSCPIALAVSQQKTRQQVPPIPADVKARGDRLWSAASPAVKSWAKQNAPAIAKGTGKPIDLARAAVQTRWPNLKVTGARDALTFLLVYKAAKGMQKGTSKATLGDISDQQQLAVQKAMAIYSEVCAVLSNMMKTMEDSADGIVSNIKK